MINTDGELAAHSLRTVRQQLSRELGHPFWWVFVLSRARAWTFFVPYPLLVQRKANRILFRGNAYLSIGIALWWALAKAGVRIAHFGEVYAADCGKALLTGALLVGTVLSVSIALPGQAVLRLVSSRSAAFPIHFITPSFWGFFWGVLGAILMIFFGGLTYLTPWDASWGPHVQTLAVAIALYGALMELNAITFTIRMYLIGLLQVSKEEADRVKLAESTRRDQMRFGLNPPRWRRRSV